MGVDFAMTAAASSTKELTFERQARVTDFNGILPEAIPKELIAIICEYTRFTFSTSPVALPSKIEWHAQKGSDVLFTSEGALHVVDLAHNCALRTLTFPKDGSLKLPSLFLRNPNREILYSIRSSVLSIWDIQGTTLVFRTTKALQHVGFKCLEFDSSSNTLLIASKKGCSVYSEMGDERIVFPAPEFVFLSFGKVPERDHEYYFTFGNTLEFRSALNPKKVSRSFPLTENPITLPKHIMQGHHLIFAENPLLMTCDLHSAKPKLSHTVVCTTDLRVIRGLTANTNGIYAFLRGRWQPNLNQVLAKYDTNGSSLGMFIPTQTLTQIAAFGNTLFFYSESCNIEISEKDKKRSTTVTGYVATQYDLKPLAWHATLS